MVYNLPRNAGKHLLLLGLEVVEEDRSLRRLLTPILNNDARAVDNLARIAFPVQDTYK